MAVQVRHRVCQAPRKDNTMSDVAKVANDAAIIREFVKHPGMKLLSDKINNGIDGKRMAWLNAKNPLEAEELRQSARCYALLSSILNEFLVRAQLEESKRTNTPE